MSTIQVHIIGEVVLKVNLPIRKAKGCRYRFTSHRARMCNHTSTTMTHSVKSWSRDGRYRRGVYRSTDRQANETDWDQKQWPVPWSVASLEIHSVTEERETSGVARNFRQGVRQSLAFLPINPYSAALPSRPYSQKTLWYEPDRLYEKLHVIGHWPHK